MSYKKLWIALILVVTLSFAVLGGVGYRGIKHGPPQLTAVVTTDGQTLFDGAAITRGQNAWQSIGGQETGSIWGHGSYVAPDWTADWLHREATDILDRWAQEEGAANCAALSVEDQAGLRARLISEMRTNTYDPQTGRVTVSPVRAAAFHDLSAYYADVFSKGRKEYAIAPGALTDPQKLADMSAFFWYTSWVASTNRPGSDVSYTQNWPAESLVGNHPTGNAILWSVFSVIMLLAGVGGLVWYMGFKRGQKEDDEPLLPKRDPFLSFNVTPSQRATLKYFLVVAALIITQLLMGGIVAHYGVEGQGFYGIPLAKYLPYSIARTWHLQLGIFWIATSWLATGLFIAPAIGGREPKGQRLGVNILFGALILVVGGSMTGEWLGIQQKLGNLWFWFGSQGYEYVDLGRVWQVALFGGLVFWLWLMYRGLKPALARRDENRSLLFLFLTSSVAIAGFYSAGLMYGQRSPVITAEYWRWWVVHLWVEGFFEVFATVVIAFLFTRLKLLSVRTATTSVLFSTSIFLSGGIIGTFHHLYFTGMPNYVMALGGVFSALEIVPLVLVGFEAWENIRMARPRMGADWLGAYKWPVYFFVAVAFWNFVGAGLFGFMINPPVALYYMQGLNTTPVHGHAALFGVYGMLGIGLMLFCLRALKPSLIWKDRPIAFAFWMLNLGLLAMVTLSLLPIGLLQAWASIDVGMWYARSAEFMQRPIVQDLRWLRMVGDILFTFGALALAWFVIGTATGWSYRKTTRIEEPVEAELAVAGD